MSGAGSWKISSARERPPPRKAKAAARRRRRCSAAAAASPAKPTRLPRSCRSARLRWMRPIGTRSSTSAAAWFCGCGGANAGERSRSRHLAFDRPGRHAQVVRRPRRPGSQPARRGPRLGRLAHIYKPQASDDEDTGLRARRLLDPGPAPRAGPLRASRRASGGVHRALADRSPRRCWTASTSRRSAAASATRGRGSPRPEKTRIFLDFFAIWRFWRLTRALALDIVDRKWKLDDPAMDAAVGLAQAERENEKLRADNADLGRRLEQLGIDNADPERQLDWFRRQLFGSKSEKRARDPARADDVLGAARTGGSEAARGAGIRTRRAQEARKEELRGRGRRIRARVRAGRARPTGCFGRHRFRPRSTTRSSAPFWKARRSRWTRRRSGPGGPAPGKMRTAWFWPVFGDRDEIAFPFRLSRENGAVPDLLGDFKGTLLSDGNQAYAAYAESRNGAVRHAGCRSHARREFEKAKDSEPGLSAEALEPVGGLFLCERKIRKKKPEGREKLEFRRSRALPVAEAFWKWCRRHYEDPAPPAEKPDREGPGLRPEPEGAAGGLAFRPRRPARHQPSGARPAGPAARQEELALLLDGGRGGSRRDRPEPGRHVPAPGRRPSEPARKTRPANLRPSLEPRRGARAEKMEGSVRRRSDDLGPRNRSPASRPLPRPGDVADDPERAGGLRQTAGDRLADRLVLEFRD